jgi:hypothetical protein
VLHCRLREKLVAYVRDLEAGRYLPRQRLVVEPTYQNDSQGREQRDGNAAAQKQPAGEHDQELLHQLLNQDGNNES